MKFSNPTHILLKSILFCPFIVIHPANAEQKNDSEFQRIQKQARKDVFTDECVGDWKKASSSWIEWTSGASETYFLKLLLRETNQTSLPFPEVSFSCLLFNPFMLCFRSMAAERPLRAFLRLRVRRMELLDFQFTFHRFGPVWTPLTQNHSLSESSWPQPSSLPQVGNQGCRKLKSSASPKASANHGKPSKSKPPPDSQH